MIFIIFREQKIACQTSIKEQIKGKGRPMDSTRDFILEILGRSREHLSAKEIYDTLYSAHPGIGLTTVYRTLELFHRLRVVQKVASPDGQGRYELRPGESKWHHHHLICLSCGKIIDYQDFAEEELQLVKKQKKFCLRNTIL